MVEGLMMSTFKRGISEKFVEELEKLAGQEGWWRDVVMDPSLIIGVREST